MAYEGLYKEEETEAPEDGGTLRAKLEKALEINHKLTTEVRAGRVKEALAAEGVSLVTEEDLTDVPLDKIQAKVEEVQAQRVEQQDEIVRRSLAARGIDEASIQALLDNRADEKSAQRISVVSGIAGTSVLHLDKENLHGADAIKAAFADQNKV